MNFENIIDFIKNKKEINHDLGQNFLIKEQIAKKIVSLLEIEQNDNVLEIGSGLGSLSVFLAKKKCKKIILNDIDKESIIILKKIFFNNKKIEIIQKNFLKININKYDKIISSVPYYITTKLLEFVLVNGINVKKCVFLVQKDLLERLFSKKDNKTYGPLIILLKNITILKKELDVEKNAFFPMPHVNSSVFSLIFREELPFSRYEYFIFLKKMFFFRRKTLLKNLSFFLKNNDLAKKILKKLKISFLLRPEQIDEKKYIEIFNETVLKNTNN